MARRRLKTAAARAVDPMDDDFDDFDDDFDEDDEDDGMTVSPSASPE